MGMEKSSPSPKLYQHPLDKEKIDAMVKAAYKEESDTLKVSDVRQDMNCTLELIFICQERKCSVNYDLYVE